MNSNKQVTVKFDAAELSPQVPLLLALFAVVLLIAVCIPNLP